MSRTKIAPPATPGWLTERLARAVMSKHYSTTCRCSGCVAVRVLATVALGPNEDRVGAPSRNARRGR